MHVFDQTFRYVNSGFNSTFNEFKMAEKFVVSFLFFVVRLSLVDAVIHK